MKLKHIFAAATLAAGLCASSAQAVVLDLTEMLDLNGAFNTSFMHDQTNGRMSGNNVGDFSNVITGGSFDTVTGAISFSGSISDGTDSSTFDASGNLNIGTTRAAGLDGNISFDFTGSLFSGVFNFLFPDASYPTAGNEPNGFASDGAGTNYIALWGDLGNFPNGCSASPCYGIDIAIRHNGNPEGGAIPLPASAFLLLGAIGGLGVTRKLRKKA